MILKIKALGLALLAMTALAAIAASSAQAGTFDVGTPHGVLIGHSEPSQQHQFTLKRTNGETLSLKCATASFEGTTQGESITGATVTPTFEKCVLFGLATPILMNGCKFRSEGGEPMTFLFAIVGCTAGKQMQIKNAACTLDIPEQTGLSHVVATNLPSNQVTVAGTVSNLTATQTGALCPDGNNHHSSLTFLSNTTVKAFRYLGSQLVTKHGHQYGESIPGEQVSMTAT
jgi:hypothetical protein